MRRTPHLSFWLSLVVALILQLVELPTTLVWIRPLWIPLVLCFWALTEPRVPVLVAAFVFGLALDVLFDSVLGQNALGCIVVTYYAVKLRTVLVMVPLWQSTIALLPAWAVYSVLMFWIDGVARHRADTWLRWLPILSSTLFWPPVYLLLDLLARRRRPEE